MASVIDLANLALLELHVNLLWSCGTDGDTKSVDLSCTGNMVRLDP